MNDPILHLLGLAKKAGKLEIGEEPVGAACRSRHARLVLLADDAAANSSRRAAHFGQAGNVLFLQLPYTKSELGAQLGRTSVAMIALTDAGFAGAIGEKLALQNPEKYAAAAAQLTEKATRVHQRRQEQRRHEEKVRQKKTGKPWAPPPREREQRGQKKAPKSPPASGSGTPPSAKRPSTQGVRLTVRRGPGTPKTRKP